MGSNPKRAVFTPGVGQAITSWHKGAKRNAKKRLKAEAPDRGIAGRTVGRASTDGDEIEPTDGIGPQRLAKSGDIENQMEEEEEDDSENMMDSWEDLHDSPPLAFDLEDEERMSSTHRYEKN